MKQVTKYIVSCGGRVCVLVRTLQPLPEPVLIEEWYLTSWRTIALAAEFGWGIFGHEIEETGEPGKYRLVNDWQNRVITDLIPLGDPMKTKVQELPRPEDE